MCVIRTRGARLARIGAASALAAAAVAAPALAEDAGTFTFKIDSGLVEPTPDDAERAARGSFEDATPAYAGEVGGLDRPGEHRIELHWRTPPGSSEPVPVLWEPKTFCATPLKKLDLGIGKWMFVRAGDAPPIETACNPWPRIGGTAGIAALVVEPSIVGDAPRYVVEALLPDTPAGMRGPLGTLAPSPEILSNPARGHLEERFFVAHRAMAAYPAPMTAEATDRRGRRHRLSFHRVRFAGDEPPYLNVYDRDSGCVLATADFPPGADTSDFALRRKMDGHTPAGTAATCDRGASLESAAGGDEAVAAVFEFRRRPAGGYALEVYRATFMQDRTEADVLARGTAHAAPLGTLYRDPTPADGLRDLAGMFLVTNVGLFRATRDDGNERFAVVETTDVYGAFRPGDRFFLAGLSPETQQLRLWQYERTGDGGRCPDTLPDAPAILKLRAEAGGPGGARVWTGRDVTPPDGNRRCATRRVRVDNCKPFDCVQWSDTLADAGDATWILTDSEAHARAVYAGISKWTRASRGYRHHWNERGQVVVPRDGGSAPPWDECGPEGCESRRRREQMDELLIDLWNR